MLLYILLFTALFAGNSVQEISRSAAVAGSFYPSDARKIQSMLSGFFDNTKRIQINGRIIGIVSPHAGYVYSGQVAAHAYSTLKDRNIKRAIVLSPSHTVSFKGASIYNGDAYETPLGQIPVDKDFCQQLAKQSVSLQFSDIGHQNTGRARAEHALEVQLPFLQHVLGEFQLVPIIFGEQSYATCRAVGEALATAIGNDEHTVIVASSDLSHYHPYDEAVSLDKKLLNAVEEWDYYNVSRNCQTRHWEACGGGPIVALMIAADKLGANISRVLKYANSGDVAQGDKTHVVGYAAIVFHSEERSDLKESADFSVNKEEKAHLLSIVRNAVSQSVVHGKFYECSAGDYSKLMIDRGTFVTIKMNGNLRGCIGFTSPVQPLCLAVRDAAVSAALRDPRFTPITENELPHLQYEISVLSPLRRIHDPKEIIIGKHGLVIKNGDREGLLLPQVATEYKWDVQTFLRHTCRKAGLPLDAWQDRQTDIFIFSAQVFGEEI
jgi:AmmeMemoRadiSam system protein B/AmmeMemoRadiSam system protein A